jgi:hypothetical protein
MNDRAFRLDFFIAIAALVVSILTTATLVYQTHVIGEQYAATIWPYLSINSSYSPHGQRLDIVNDGVGPALIESAQLSVDGKPVSSWKDYLKALADQPSIRTLYRKSEAAMLLGQRPDGKISTSSTGPGSTIRPGDKVELLDMEMPAYVPLTALQSHRISFDFCYCSLNGSCWTHHATPGATKSEPRIPVSHCATSATIG